MDILKPSSYPSIVIGPFYKTNWADQAGYINYQFPDHTLSIAIPKLKEEVWSNEMCGHTGTFPPGFSSVLTADMVTSLFDLQRALENTSYDLNTSDLTTVAGAGIYDTVLMQSTETLVKGQNEAELISKVFHIMHVLGEKSGFTDVFKSHCQKNADNRLEHRTQTPCILCDKDIAEDLNIFSGATCFRPSSDPRMKGRIFIGLNSCLTLGGAEDPSILSFGYLGYQNPEKEVCETETKFRLSHRFINHIPALGVIDVNRT